MKKILILFLIFTFSIKAETANPDAIYEKLKYEYILNKDGSIEYNYEHSLRYLTYFSINRLLGESFIVYNPEFQTLKITKSETIMNDGTLVKAPFNSFNEVLPRNAANTPGYFHLREMVVTHTGLERNCIVNFGYKITTKPNFLPGLFGDIVIGSHHPIKNLEIVIKVPSGTNLNLFMANNGPMGEKSTQGNFDVYKWDLKNIPMFPVESNQPNFKEYLPVLYFSTVTVGQIMENLINKNDLYSLNNQAKAKIEEILKDKFTFLDKITALRNFVYSNISGANFNLNLIGMKPQTAQITFNRGSGSYLDKAILLKAMCEFVGIKSELALSTNYTTEKPDLSLLSEFNVFLVNCKSPKDELNILLDPNVNQTSLVPQTALNKTVFSLSNDKVYLIKPFQSQNSSSFIANLDFNNLNLKSKYLATGEYIEDLDINSFDNKFNSFLKSRKFKIEKNISPGKYIINHFEKEINCKIVTENFTDEILKLIFPQMPGCYNEKHIRMVPTTRITPVKLDKIYNEEYYVLIDLGNSNKKLVNPVEIKEDNSIGNVEITIRQNGNSIEFKRKLTLKKQFVEPKDYHLLYKIISHWDNDKYRCIYLK